MKLTASDAVPSDQWNAQVEEMGGTIFHTSVWAAYRVAANPNGSPYFFTWDDDQGQRMGVAMGFREKSPRALMSRLTRRLSLATLPVVREQNPQTLTQCVELLVEHARGSGYVYLDIDSFAAPASKDTLQALGFETTGRIEFELDLTRTEDDLWTAMEHKRRKNIKKAGRKNVTLEEPPPAEAAAHLRRLQGESARRIVERGGRDITFQGSGPRDPVEILLEAGVARLVCACADGQVESAGLFTAFNGLVYHTLSGHSRVGLEAQAPTLLLWETLKRYKAEGMKRLNFGGCSADAVNEDSPEHGVYQYKKDWGGNVLPCTSGRKVLRPLAHRLVNTARAVLGR